MLRQRNILVAVTVAANLFWSVAAAEASDIRGHYLESRTCQVYTGPCFANAEIGLCGKNAVLAWDIASGSHAGVDLAGLKVVMALDTTKTLAFQGLADAGEIKSVVYVDQRATAAQQEALVEFAKQHTGQSAVVRVTAAPIAMELDIVSLQGTLQVGEKDVRLQARKARPEDCICSNESAYYPPLVAVENFVPGVATVGQFKGRGLGATWSNPESRSVYMATFAY